MTTLFDPGIPAATTTEPRPLYAVTGLDLSLTGAGIASSHGWCTTVGYTNKKNPITKLPHTQRLDAMRTVRDGIILQTGRPDLAIIELPAPSRAGGGAHERAWLWWEIFEYLDTHEVPIGLMSTGQLKVYAAGKGNVDKNVVVDAVARRWPDWPTGGDDNAADAVVLMAAGMDWLGCPIVAVPKVHRAAVEKAQWPDREQVLR